MFRSIFGGKRTFRSHRDTLLQFERHNIRMYACVTESDAQMWNLRPRDTRNTRFKKKRRATFIPLPFGNVVRLLNSIQLAVCTLQLNLRYKDPISALDVRSSHMSTFACNFDLFGQTLHGLDGRRHFALESLQHGPVLVQCDFTGTVFSCVESNPITIGSNSADLSRNYLNALYVSCW